MVFLKENKWVLLIYFLLVGISVYYLLRIDKVNLHYQMNQVVGHAFPDFFFYWITYLGDGMIAAVLIGVVLLFHLRNGLALLVCFAMAGLITFCIKQIGYDDVNRPSFVFYFFVQGKTLKYVDGVDLHIHNSFPSGHATQAFAIFGLLAFFSGTQWQKLSCILIAILTAYSRVYLSQHWLVDIVGGSVVGISTAIVVYLLVKRFFELDRWKRPVWQLKT